MYSPNDDSPVPPNTPYACAAPGPATPLCGEISADIVVVGGGIGGCSVALHAAEGGARVILLEAKTIGWGAAGRNSGHVPPATKHSPEEMLRIYGPERGDRLLAAIRGGPDLVFGLAEKHGMKASVARCGSIVAAHTVATRERLARRAEDLQARGYPVALLDQERTAQAIGSGPGYYLAALLDQQGGTIDPLAYVRGLARAAGAAGAIIHEGSKATRLQKMHGKWRVDTDRGRVTADFVVLCTNAYTDDLWPALRPTIVPVRAYQYVTPPLPDVVRRTILPGGQGMTDTRRLMSGVRVLSDGRLFFSGRGPPFGPEGTPALGPSLGRVRAIFPQLDKIGVESWWTGWVAMNHENSWKIHEPAPGLLAALGCNGRGVAIATILGRELARYMLGTPARDLIMPFSPLRRILGHAIHPPLVKLLISYYQIRDALDEPRRHAGRTNARSA